MPVVLTTKNSASQDINVFPNPCLNSFRVEGLPDKSSVNLINMQGQRWVVPANESQFDISALASGFYMVEIVQQDKLSYSKLIKK
jgi:hypothetical protein